MVRFGPGVPPYGFTGLALSPCTVQRERRKQVSVTATAVAATIAAATETGAGFHGTGNIHRHGASFNGTAIQAINGLLRLTVRYEWLSQYHWRNLDEVRDYATQWMWRYNHERPNMASGGITPKQRLAMAA